MAANDFVKSLVPREQHFQPSLRPTEYRGRMFRKNPVELESPGARSQCRNNLPHFLAITAVGVTPAGAGDFFERMPRLLHQQLLALRKFCADSRFGVTKVCAELRRRGNSATIPLRSPKSWQLKPGRLPITTSTYVPGRDVYLRPQVRELRPAAYELRWDLYHYRL